LASDPYSDPKVEGIKISQRPYAYEAPVVRRGRRVYPLSSVTGVEVGARDWSDGAPTYHLRIVMDDGTVIER
jgi:hypothetical protein